MKRTRIRLLGPALAAAALVAAHAVAPRAAGANETSRVWGMSNLGDTCSGLCGAQNICCKITIVAPPP